MLWVLLAVAILLVSAAVGAGVELAINRDASTSSNASRFVVPGSPFDGGAGSAPAAPSGLPVETIASRVDPGTVNIATTLSGGAEAAGSGMVITRSGEVLTNNHVINGATKITVEIGVTGETHTAKVLGYDVADDVALLKVDGVSNLKTVDLGSAASVNVNDQVVAIGNALGRFGTPTAAGGVVTGVNRTITAGDRVAADTETLTGMIQFRAAIQPGDSGGPLVERSAKVVGMVTAADTGGNRFGYSAGSAGFAIPIDKAMSIVHRIESGTGSDRVHIGGGRALLGVVLDTGGAGLGTSPSGAAVAEVESGSGAGAVGIQPGDTIVSLGGTPVGSASELRAALGRHQAGDRVSITWVDSAGAQHSATVKLGSGPPA